MQWPRVGNGETNVAFDNNNGLKLDSAENSSNMVLVLHDCLRQPSSRWKVLPVHPHLHLCGHAWSLAASTPDWRTSAQLLIAKRVRRSRCSPVQQGMLHDRHSVVPCGRAVISTPDPRPPAQATAGTLSVAANPPPHFPYSIFDCCPLERFFAGHPTCSTLSAIQLDPATHCPFQLLSLEYSPYRVPYFPVMPALTVRFDCSRKQIGMRAKQKSKVVPV